MIFFEKKRLNQLFAIYSFKFKEVFFSGYELLILNLKNKEYRVCFVSHVLSLHVWKLKCMIKIKDLFLTKKKHLSKIDYFFIMNYST